MGGYQWPFPPGVEDDRLLQMYLEAQLQLEDLEQQMLNEELAGM